MSNQKVGIRHSADLSIVLLNLHRLSESDEKVAIGSKMMLEDCELPCNCTITEIALQATNSLAFCAILCDWICSIDHVDRRANQALWSYCVLCYIESQGGPPTPTLNGAPEIGLNSCSKLPFAPSSRGPTNE